MTSRCGPAFKKSTIRVNGDTVQDQDPAPPTPLNIAHFFRVSLRKMASVTSRTSVVATGSSRVSWIGPTWTTPVLMSFQRLWSAISVFSPYQIFDLRFSLHWNHSQEVICCSPRKSYSIFPTRLLRSIWQAIRQKYRFALLTNATTPRHAVNIDIEPGGFRPICLQDPPFSIPGAIAFTYFVPIEGITWKNAVFLMMGEQK